MQIESFVKDSGLLSGIQSLLKTSTFPALESFELSFFKAPNHMDNVVPTPQFSNLYVELYGFLARHAGSLRKLFLDKPLKLKMEGYIPVLGQDVREGLVRLNLEELQICQGYYETEFWSMGE